MAKECPADAATVGGVSDAVRGLAAVFWEAGAVGGLRVDAPCIARWKTVDGQMTVAVAGPAHAARTINVHWQDRGERSVEVRNGRPGSVTF